MAQTKEEKALRNKQWREDNKERLREYTKQRRLKYKEQFNSFNKEYRKQYPEKYLLSAVKSRAKKYNIQFNLTEEDIVIPEYCPVFGYKLETHNKSGPSRTSPSVDRIDPTKGYTKGNIQIISHQANTMKNNASKEELLLFAKWIINNGTNSQ